MGEVSKEINRESPDFFPVKPTDYGRFLVLSLGTGTAKTEEKYDANKAAKWGVLGWASSDMVDLHLGTVFQALRSEKNYLRIQDDTLAGKLASVDIATKENLENLVKVGEGLLKKPVSRVNLDTGVYEPANKLTNEEALITYKSVLGV
ncbi:hypothetical protein NC651_006149 [Populus alba x Populus x berolinensis]|nr:hypothetical protein NC651_006149 [Populus alba x Populus x berolinensis]